MRTKQDIPRCSWVNLNNPRYVAYHDTIWDKPIHETSLAESGLSLTIAQDLKRLSMKFVGSTVIYVYLQAIGIINSHEPPCFLAP